MPPTRRIAVIGLDCAEASLVFDEFRDAMPCLSTLMAHGSYGVLESCHPPITVPAWSVMTSGYDAGQLGCYGFRNRIDRSYDRLSIAFSTAIERPRIWDRFSAAGRDSIVLGVPQTFPIERPPRGVMVADFLTPNKQAAWCWPASLAAEIEMAAEGDYLFDVAGFRTVEKRRLLEQIRQMTRRRFQVARHLLQTQPWELFWMVEMGPDRLHHAFWRHADPRHPRFAGEDDPFRWALRDYYRELDEQVGALVAELPSDALVVVVSDHGAQPLLGGIAVNEWLVRQGYLVLHEYPATPTPPAELKIDWSRTKAWSEGGYYARVFLNVRGREPRGAIDPSEYETWRTRLIAEMEALPGPAGEAIGTRVHRPEELWSECQGVPPDLVCYWGNLKYRSVGSVGDPAGSEAAGIYTSGNDTGPDEANHDWSGIFISRYPLAGRPGQVEGLRLIDVGVSLMAAAGLDTPDDTAGRPALNW